MFSQVNWHRPGARSTEPTAAPPGSEQKIQAMIARAERHEALFHPDDGPWSIVSAMRAALEAKKGPRLHHLDEEATSTTPPNGEAIRLGARMSLPIVEEPISSTETRLDTAPGDGFAA